MKHGHTLAIGLLGLAVAACGGGGGGSTSSASPGLSITPRVEAILTDPSLDPNYRYQDPANIQAGDSITFQLVNYTTSGGSTVRNVLSSVNWRTTDTTGSTGVLSPTTGLFDASSLDSAGQNYVVVGAYSGQEFKANYTIKARQVRLRGRVVNEETGDPIPYVQIEFYGPRNPADSDSATIVVGRVNSAIDGTFRASIPASTTGFTVVSSTVPSSYYGSFLFRGGRFDAGSQFCRPLFDTPYANGDRSLLDSEDDDVTTNGTIVLSPRSLYETKPEADGCGS